MHTVRVYVSALFSSQGLSCGAAGRLELAADIPAEEHLSPPPVYRVLSCYNYIHSTTTITEKFHTQTNNYTNGYKQS